MKIEIKAPDFLTLKEARERAESGTEVFFIQENEGQALDSDKWASGIETTRTKLKVEDGDDCGRIMADCSDVIFECFDEGETAYYYDPENDTLNETVYYLVDIREFDINDNEEFIEMFQEQAPFMLYDELIDLVVTYLRNQ